ncbi:MAG TPA: malto-oligosyltrehalose trehalohydrolase [Rhizomicrobium sp.]|nr:malto-oligosyltrehalose trehalohydrolase [Rhizomicrobium sp.]
MIAPAFGPRIEGDEVRFSLWAPDAAQVLLETENGAQALHDAGDGWKEARLPGGPGLKYRFRIADVVFPDPASRRQQGGVHGWSIVTAPSQGDGWRGRPWHETVLYECHAGLMGGFDGIAARLSGLAQLGITAIELMPIAAFPGARNWGYDGVLPYAIAESYGSLDSLRALIAMAHARNVSVFLDVVYNHFGPDGNYLPLYAKAFFRDDRPTPWGPAIDFRVPQVRQFFTDNARYWLFDIGFDGLRFDAVHAIIDDGWLDELSAGLRHEAGDRHIHLVLENEDNIAGYLRRGFDAQWNDDIHHALHVLLTGETHAYYKDFARQPALLAGSLAEGFIYQGQASINRGGKPRGEPSQDLPPTAFVSFLQNHDQTGNRAFGDRLAALADIDALKAAVALLLLAPQIPMIFMGEEIGSTSPFLFFTDHGPELAKMVREGRRREFAEFAHAAGNREIPDPNALSTFQASAPENNAAEKDAWLALYRELLKLRHRHVVPRLKDARAISAGVIGEKAVIARWRMADSKELTLACNLGDQPVETALPDCAPFWGTVATAIAPTTTLAWLTP